LVQNDTRPSPLERLLATFTDIRAGEGITGVVLFANVFLILCAYYFVKPLRDSWIAVSNVEGLSTMEVKAYSSFAQSLLLAGIASLFARLSARVPRRKLITGSTLICMSNLAIFWMLQPGFLIENLPYSGVVFYLWVGMFGVFIVAQFWTLAADLYAGERGTRLLPLIAIGATGGAAFGSYLTKYLSEYFDPGNLLLIANVPLGLSILLTRAADARGPLGGGSIPEPTTQPEKKSAAGAGASRTNSHGAIKFVLSHPYLLSVAFVVMLTNWVNTNGENLIFGVLQQDLMHRAAAEGIAAGVPTTNFIRLETAQFYAGYLFWVNVIALVSQAFLASRVLRYGGFAALMLLLPTVSLVSYTAMAFLPLLWVVRAGKTAENSMDYSINNTARQVLWLPTSAETKYRAKPAIDSLFVRLGDGFAALTVLVGVHFLELSNRSLFVLNIALVVVWLALAVAIVGTYSRMMAEREHTATS
jgi:ATP:ADP antiporter, AAA family